MKKLLLVSLVVLSGCSTLPKDQIIGHWSEQNKVCGKKPFCSFTITSNYEMKFDVVTPGFTNNAKIIPNYKGTPGVYWYTKPGTNKGLMMYLDKDTLVETYNGVRYKKTL